MASKIEKEVLELTGLKPKPKEARQTFLARMFAECDDLFSDDDSEGSKEKADKNWENATEELQRWYRKAAKLKEADEEIPEFPDVEKAEEKVEEKEDEDTDTETETDADEEEPESADKEEEDEDTDMATNGKKKGKVGRPPKATNGDTPKRRGRSPKAAKEKAVKAEKPEKPVKVKVGRPAKAKKASKGNGEASKKVGVMAEIKRMFQRSEGASIKEVIASLAKKFPERPEESMAISARAFAYVAGPKALGKKLKKTKDEKRGNVFKYPANAD